VCVGWEREREKDRVVGREGKGEKGGEREMGVEGEEGEGGRYGGRER